MIKFESNWKIAEHGGKKTKIFSCGLQKSQQMQSKHQRKYSHPNKRV
jgi:hypothetical protein